MRIKPWLLGVPAGIGLTGAVLASLTGTVAGKVERALPPLGRFVTIGGTRLHYLDEGPEQPDPDAPTIVLIHGLAGQTRNFTYGVVAPLARTHRVITLDRPGSGYSPRAPGAPATLSAQADSVAALITALGLEKPVVVGHSLGGAIALALALNHPEQVGALALIAPLTHPLDTPPRGLEGLAIASPLRRALTAWTLALPSAILNRNRVLAALFGPEPAPADFGTRGGGLLSLRPTSFYGASTDMVHSGADLAGMVARYPSLRLPVGVLYGSGDRILDPIFHGRALEALIPDLELELIEGGGHMLPITLPERTAEFIKRVAARRGEPA